MLIRQLEAADRIGRGEAENRAQPENPGRALAVAFPLDWHIRLRFRRVHSPPPAQAIVTDHNRRRHSGRLPGLLTGTTFITVKPALNRIRIRDHHQQHLTAFRRDRGGGRRLG